MMKCKFTSKQLARVRKQSRAAMKLIENNDRILSREMDRAENRVVYLDTLTRPTGVHKLEQRRLEKYGDKLNAAQVFA